MLGWIPLEPWPPELDEVTGDGTIAAMPVGLPLTVVLHYALPDGQELRGTPVSISQGGPGPPHGCGTEPEIGECGDDCAAALEQASTEQRPQEVEKA
jgi:hypothetical protein